MIEMPDYVYLYRTENANSSLGLHRIKVLGVVGIDHIRVSRCAGSDHRQILLAPGYNGAFVYATPEQAANAYEKSLDRMEDSCLRQLARIERLRDELQQLR